MRLTRICKADVSDAAQLNRLLELCQGMARALIKCCALKKPTAGYQRARQLLDARFGDAYMIYEAQVRKIIDGPAVKPNNTESLQTLLMTSEIVSMVQKKPSKGQSFELTVAPEYPKSSLPKASFFARILV